MWTSIPPAWSPVPVVYWPRTAERGLSIFPERTEFLNSGTAAISLAVSRIAGRSREIHGDRDFEVLIPGYCCPNIVAAVQFSGVRCVPCDLDEWSLFMSSRAISDSFSDNTIGAISIRPFGMENDAEEYALRARLDPAKIIMDCCQSSPSSVSTDGEYSYVFSFGRGKAACAIRGGALVGSLGWAAGSARPDLSRCTTKMPAWGKGLRLMSGIALATAHNFLTRSVPYAIVEKSGFLGLGSSHFRPIDEVSCLSDVDIDRVGAAVARARRVCSEANRQLYDWLLERETLGNLRVPIPGEKIDPANLLRIPVFAMSREIRDGAVRALRSLGLGGSSMYGAPINQIPGVPGMRIGINGLKNSAACADKLFTLPNHARVTPRDVSAIIDVLKRFC